MDQLDCEFNIAVWCETPALDSWHYSIGYKFKNDRKSYWELVDVLLNIILHGLRLLNIELYIVTTRFIFYSYWSKLLYSIVIE